MIKKRLLFCLMLVLGLVSCFNKKTGETALKIKSRFGAQECTINYTQNMGDAKPNEVEVVIIQPDSFVLASNKVSVLSSAALVYFQSVTEAEKKAYPVLKVTVTTKDSSFDKSYSMEELSMAQRNFAFARDFLKLLTEEKNDSLQRYIDITEVPDSFLQRVTRLVSMIDSAGGKTRTLTNSGFASSVLPGSKERFPMLWFEVLTGNIHTHYSIGVSDKRKKIICIGMNDLGK